MLCLLGQRKQCHISFISNAELSIHVVSNDLYQVTVKHGSWPEVGHYVGWDPESLKSDSLMWFQHLLCSKDIVELAHIVRL